MKPFKLIFPVLGLIILIMLGWSCSSDECMQNKNALPLAGFYNSYSPDTKINVDSIEVSGLGAPGDSILFAGKSAINELYLPFRLDHDTTAYVFRYLHKELAAMNLTDTIRFIYTREPRFVSSACGVSYVFDIDSIETTHAIIDSVSCPFGQITNMATENLHIYFRVNPE